MSYPKPLLEKNDKVVKWLIGIVSVLVFMIVASLPKIHLGIQLPFNAHILQHLMRLSIQLFRCF